MCRLDILGLLLLLTLDASGGVWAADIRRGDGTESMGARLLDSQRQWQRAAQVLEDLKEAAHDVYVALLGRYHQALVTSWQHFQPRAARLAQLLQSAYESTTSKGHQFHEAAMQRTRHLLKSLPFTPEALSGDAACQAILVYVYGVLAILTAKGIWILFTKILYA